MFKQYKFENNVTFFKSCYVNAFTFSILAFITDSEKTRKSENKAVEANIPRHRDSTTKKSRHRDFRTKKSQHRDSGTKKPRHRETETTKSRHRDSKAFFQKTKNHDIEMPRLKNNDIEIPSPKSYDIEFLQNSDTYAPLYLKYVVIALILF